MKRKIIKKSKKANIIIYNAKEFQKIKCESSLFYNFLKTLKQMKKKTIFKILESRFKYIIYCNADFYLHFIEPK